MSKEQITAVINAISALRSAGQQAVANALEQAFWLELNQIP